jgi:RNA polymerase sigma-70 factor (ECF subfamily)
MAALIGPELVRCLERARSGDGNALGQLLEQYRAYMTLLARLQISQRLRGKVDPSDIVQETFCKASQAFGRFRGTQERELLAWLRTILATSIAGQIRRYCGTQQRDIQLERRLLDSLDASSQALDGYLISPGSSPSYQAGRREHAALAADAISRLPDHYQDVLIQRHLEGLSFPEIALRMNRSVGSVLGLWARALARLRETFGAQT